MANFRLAPGQITIGVVHRTVDEVWMVTGGEGSIWRCPDGRQDLGSEDKLIPGVSIPIPVGTHFQFRAAEGTFLDILGVTVPPWPGGNEAIVSNIAPWKPNVAAAA
jgi:mannose-6-phosphate isomerase-like protein (cupin superfamily)